MSVKKGRSYDIKIDKLAYGGKSIGKIDDFVVFIPYGVPGDIAKVLITKKRKNYAEGRIENLISSSPERINSPCPYFGNCGGCKWQNIPYKKQVKIKTDIVQESLKHISKLGAVVLPTLPAAYPYHYRNKMEFTFSEIRWLLPEELGNPDISKNSSLGFHVPGAFDRVIDVEKCMLQSDLLNNILKDVKEYVFDKKLPLYHLKNHSGQMRFLILRQTWFSNQVMVNIVTTQEMSNVLLPLAQLLEYKYPQIKSVMNNVNSGLAQVAFGEQEYLLFGEPWIEEHLDGIRFSISANSFFQTNSLQALTLFKTVAEFAGLTGEEHVWDLYGGTGAIALFLAKKAGRIVSVEMTDSAINDGRKNARLNNINNVEFIHGDMKDIIHNLEHQPDVIITDPPRDGMHPQVVQALAERQPGRIVYVSCNPVTLARDLILLNDVYHVKKVQPVDMFPQTYHIENIALLELK